MSGFEPGASWFVALRKLSPAPRQRHLSELGSLSLMMMMMMMMMMTSLASQCLDYTTEMTQQELDAIFEDDLREHDFTVVREGCH